MRLGDSSWWLSIESSGEAWLLHQVIAGKRPRTVRVGRYTSWRHCLQAMENAPKSRKVPKEVLRALRDLVGATEAGGEYLGELPGEPSESSGAVGDGASRTDPQPPEDDDEGSE
jgi:hypothetical protein